MVSVGVFDARLLTMRLMVARWTRKRRTILAVDLPISIRSVDNQIEACLSDYFVVKAKQLKAVMKW